MNKPIPSYVRIIEPRSRLTADEWHSPKCAMYYFTPEFLGAVNEMIDGGKIKHPFKRIMYRQARRRTVELGGAERRLTIHNFSP